MSCMNQQDIPVELTNLDGINESPSSAIYDVSLGNASTSCVDDSDCDLTEYLHGSCCIGCGFIAYNTTTITNNINWRKYHCNESEYWKSCDLVECPMMDPSTVARCVNSTCILVVPED